MYTHASSLPGIIREMDADQLEAMASEILTDTKDRPVMNHEQIILAMIQSQFKQLTGSEMIIDLQPQLAS